MKAQLLATCIDKCIPTGILKWIATPGVVIFNYHRLYEPPLETHMDEGVFGHSVAEFEAHLVWIKRHFTVIDEASLIALSEQEKLSGNYAMITFDDGYMDNYQLAMPLLLKHNLPAMFFISINHMNQLNSWWDEAAYIINKTTKTRIHFLGNTYTLSDKNILRRILKGMKTSPYNLAKTKAKLLYACGLPLETLNNMPCEFMSSKEVLHLSQLGFDIGSHTVTHKILSSLTKREQLWELEHSKDVLTDLLRKPINSIAYPVGDSYCYNEDTLALVKDCGYQLGFTFESGLNRSINPTAQFKMKRINLTTSRSHYRLQSLFPETF